MPIAAIFCPWLRSNRFSLFLPPAALMPAAIGALIFKLIDRLQQGRHIEIVLQRPSETIETYLYFLIFAFLYSRRIKELEAAEGALPK